MLAEDGRDDDAQDEADHADDGAGGPGRDELGQVVRVPSGDEREVGGGDGLVTHQDLHAVDEGDQADQAEVGPGRRPEAVDEDDEDQVDDAQDEEVVDELEFASGVEEHLGEEFPGLFDLA